MKKRRNVYNLPAGDKTLEWYGKAVIAMRQKPTSDPRSWNFQAAMHGFNPNLPLWQGAAPLPPRTIQTRFWNQCQHGSWFFLPWHRMYLAYFEDIVAKTIVDLGGPADWALPFWDYSDASNPAARKMPPAFTTPANATNGLFMPGRNPGQIPPRFVVLDALNVLPYTGNGRTSPLGFGGPETSFSHGGGIHGELENVPHDVIHVAIGGAMGDPRTAALDPIFWLHHCNIDRLWQVWLNMGNRANPTKTSWLSFRFDFMDKNGRPARLSCKDVQDTTRVLGGYTYEGVETNADVLESMETLSQVDFSMPLEVAAATNQDVTLAGTQKTVVQLDLTSTRKQEDVLESLESAGTPPTTYLHFENITGKGVPPIHDVYINAPGDDGDKEAHYAGSLSFFGVEESSIPSVHQAGSGQHYALDVTRLMTKLRSSPNWKENELDVSLEPAQETPADGTVTIGRISLYTE